VADLDATANGDCSCDVCQGWRAANALQNGGSSCHVMASADADLQAVIAAWGGLSEPMRAAVMALVGVQKRSE
jgi:hypothetical protein